MTRTVPPGAPDGRDLAGRGPGLRDLPGRDLDGRGPGCGPVEALRRLVGDAPEVGLDLVAVDRVRRAIDRHGDRWLADMFTGAELEQLRLVRGDLPERAAGRVAAKEAVVKALRPDDLVAWHDIEVLRLPHGAPVVRLSGRAGRHAEYRGVRSVAVSITHQDGWAAAIAVAGSADPDSIEEYPHG
ncbi:holo-ACP synthase [Micromonospora sediminimaris]|uniref:Holo-[acyl-carrier-protein] synthase n=1 Tax=Micromonospora sediminimaris TaxID=547162 RepID=A0A9W5XMA4_9ACTN|nr:holo-ACP synthase [Micromonospora sediminimaris]GIJ35912.1 hypothetical protein Vse01_50600 [Micromonospora sediminimaris]SFD42590.1 holo-[acyl-carrier-protein] synthase [Micromonospora sediminimaris]